MEESKRIDDYLSGRLGQEERQAFEEELSRNPKLKEQLELQRDMDFLLKHEKERTALKAVLKSEGADFFRTEAQPQQRGRLRWIGWVVAAAAAVVLLLVLRPLLFEGSLYEEYAEFPPLALSEKGAEMDWSGAEQAFNTGDYPEASRQLEAYLQEFPDDYQARLYLGITRMQTGDLAEARRLFSEVAEASPPLANHANWYDALSYLKAGNIAAARRRLQQIESDSPFYRRAQEVMERLE